MRHVWCGQSIIWSQDFTPDILADIFKRADKYRANPRGDSLEGKRVAMLFYEESTRTRFSFEAAVQNLGGTCLSTENARQFSSVAKGESLEDSMRVISSYCDAIVLRHFEDDASMRTRDFLQSLDIWVPVINAGCGKGQHPTQSLLDLYTIWQMFGRMHDLTIAMVGDLKHGRTVRSLAYLLGKFTGNRIYFVSPVEYAIGYDILAYLRRHKVEFTQGHSLDEVIGAVDVVYMTRVQKERINGNGVASIDRCRLTVARAERMQAHAKILHPLPKVDEIDSEVYRLPQAAFFEQSDNGVPIRQALLEMVLGA